MPIVRFPEERITPVTGRRRHANGWVATVLRNGDKLIEGYLWDEHHEPIQVRRGGLDVGITQQELDEVTRGLGHVCSAQCETWAGSLPLGTPHGGWNRHRHQRKQ